MRRPLLAPLVLSAAAACATVGPSGIAVAPEVTPDMAPADGPVTMARLQRGRALFSARCPRCHVLPRPDSQPAERWPAKVTEMSRKSALSAEQIALISDYLIAAGRPRLAR